MFKRFSRRFAGQESWIMAVMDKRWKLMGLTCCSAVYLASGGGGGEDEGEEDEGEEGWYFCRSR